MTIKELITILNTYPQDTEIMVYNQQGEWYDPLKWKIGFIMKNIIIWF